MADGHADIEQVTALLKQAIDDNASDVFLIPGAPVTFKVGETHQPQGERLTPGMAREHIAAIYVLAKRIPHYDEVPHTDDDFSFAIPGIGRFRLNVYYQRNTLALRRPQAGARARDGACRQRQVDHTRLHRR